MAFVGQMGETNTGGRLLATVSVPTKQTSPTSRALTVKRRSGQLSATEGDPRAPSGAATGSARAADTTGPSDRTPIQRLADACGRRTGVVGRLSAPMSPEEATMVGDLGRDNP